VEEGIVPGGGVALLRAISVLEKVKVDNHDQQVGVEIVRVSLEEPIKQIVNNAGIEGALVVEKVRISKEASYGFNALTEEYVDMIKAGIIDPTKVTRSALQNAASVASLMLTTAVMIAEMPEEDKKMGGGHPEMGGGMGGMY